MRSSLKAIMLVVISSLQAGSQKLKQPIHLSDFHDQRHYYTCRLHLSNPSITARSDSQAIHPQIHTSPTTSLDSFHHVLSQQRHTRPDHSLYSYPSYLTAPTRAVAVQTSPTYSAETSLPQGPKKWLTAVTVAVSRAVAIIATAVALVTMIARAAARRKIRLRAKLATTVTIPAVATPAVTESTTAPAALAAPRPSPSTSINTESRTPQLRPHTSRSRLPAARATQTPTSRSSGGCWPKP
ncbi:hypothetical protein F5B18DRAFT_672067 [Nemania serpens]|nr:hypothetical protein F5B18DRAFT_672067 [Nemania serpens]